MMARSEPSRFQFQALPKRAAGGAAPIIVLGNGSPILKHRPLVCTAAEKMNPHPKPALISRLKRVWKGCGKTRISSPLS